MTRWFNEQATRAITEAGKEALKRLKERDTKDNTNFVEVKLPKLRKLYSKNNTQE